MDLRLCMFERRRPYGLMLLHITAPAVIWTYVYAYWSLAGELENADVAVAKVSYAFRRRRFRKYSEAWFCSARALASAECIIIIERHAHERPNHYVHSARESAELRLLFLSGEHSQTCVLPKTLHW